jgi:hypothetical protein
MITNIISWFSWFICWVVFIGIIELPLVTKFLMNDLKFFSTWYCNQITFAMNHEYFLLVSYLLFALCTVALFLKVKYIQLRWCMYCYWHYLCLSRLMVLYECVYFLLSLLLPATGLDNSSSPTWVCKMWWCNYNCRWQIWLSWATITLAFNLPVCFTTSEIPINSELGLVGVKLLAGQPLSRI